MITLEPHELTDDILNKKLVEIVDPNNGHRPDCETTFDDGFVIKGYQYVTPSVPTNSNGHNGNGHHGPYVILKNQHGMNLLCKNAPGILLNIED
jgi:hypothetical protein